MKLTVLQENLTKALGIAARFTSARAQLPVLGNILLKAEKTKLRLSATNLETSVVISLGAQIKEEGELTVPTKTITEIVMNLSSGPLEIESEKEHLSLKAQNFSSKVLGMNSADFPKIPQSLPTEGALTFPKEGILEALNQVISSASSDESRPVLTGVLFLFSKTGLTLVATDGFRLSQKKLLFKSSDTKDETLKVVLPKSPLLEIARLGEEAEEIKLSLKAKESQAVFGLGEVVLSSRVLEGEFPDYEKIIPKTSSIQIRTDKEELARAVKLASVFARDSANIVKITPEKEAIKLTAESSQSGNQETLIEAKIEGDNLKDFEISFNYKFLEEVLRVIKGEEVLMEFTNTNAPGVFKDPKDLDFLHLIMPVKVQS
jgi:DNA polymerase III subunit beta